jgi:hypothetical protein
MVPIGREEKRGRVCERRKRRIKEKKGKRVWP